MLTAVTDGVLVHQSELLRNNSIVVEGNAGVLLVDPGITRDELACLASDIRAMGRPVVAGFATHPDWDHALWHQELGDAPRYGTPRCARSLRDLLANPDWRAQLAEVMPPEILDDVPLEQFGEITALPDGARTIPWDGPEVRVIEHPAHARGHAALLVGDRGVLVAGDMLSDVLIPFPDMAAADPLGDYLAGLRALESVAQRVEVVIPGHGAVGGSADLLARIDLDRAYVEALRDGRPLDDPRIGPTATFGQDWLPGLAAWQREQLGSGGRAPS